MGNPGRDRRSGLNRTEQGKESLGPRGAFLRGTISGSGLRAPFAPEGRARLTPGLRTRPERDQNDNTEKREGDKFFREKKRVRLPVIEIGNWVQEEAGSIYKYRVRGWCLPSTLGAGPSLIVVPGRLAQGRWPVAGGWVAKA